MTDMEASVHPCINTLVVSKNYNVCIQHMADVTTVTTNGGVKFLKLA